MYICIDCNTLNAMLSEVLKGPFRKWGLTSVVQSMTQKKQGKGVQQGSGIPKTPFSNWPFTMDP